MDIVSVRVQKEDVYLQGGPLKVRTSHKM